MKYCETQNINLYTGFKYSMFDDDKVLKWYNLHYSKRLAS